MQWLRWSSRAALPLFSIDGTGDGREGLLSQTQTAGAGFVYEGPPCLAFMPEGQMLSSRRLRLRFEAHLSQRTARPSDAISGASARNIKYSTWTTPQIAPRYSFVRQKDLAACTGSKPR